MNRIAGFLVLWCLLLPVCEGQSAKTYPEHGTVVDLRTEAAADPTLNYADPYGKRLPVYRIETENKVYKLEGKKKDKNAFSRGDTVQFRLEKDWAYVHRGDKEQKFRVLAVELKPNGH